VEDEAAISIFDATAASSQRRSLNGNPTSGKDLQFSHPRPKGVQRKGSLNATSSLIKRSGILWSM
jgi:hypothetical protein